MGLKRVAIDKAGVAEEDLQIMNAVADTVARSKKIVVVTGAGISCSAGIPVSEL